MAREIRDTGSVFLHSSCFSLPSLAMNGATVVEKSHAIRDSDVTL